MYKYFICRLFFADKLAGIRRYNTDWLFPRSQPAKLIYFFKNTNNYKEKDCCFYQKNIFFCIAYLRQTNLIMYIIGYCCLKKHSKLIDSQCGLVWLVYLLKMVGVMCFVSDGYGRVFFVGQQSPPSYSPLCLATLRVWYDDFFKGNVSDNQILVSGLIYYSVRS